MGGSQPGSKSLFCSRGTETAIFLLVPQVSEDFRGGFGEAGDLPGLDGIHELLVGAFLGLADVLANRSQHGK